MDDELLSLDEVAEMLRLSYSTVRRYVRTGLLPAARTPTGIWRVRRADAEAFLTPHEPRLPHGKTQERAAPASVTAAHERALEKLRRGGLKV